MRSAVVGIFSGGIQLVDDLHKRTPVLPGEDEERVEGMFAEFRVGQGFVGGGGTDGEDDGDEAVFGRDEIRDKLGRLSLSCDLLEFDFAVFRPVERFVRLGVGGFDRHSEDNRFGDGGMGGNWLFGL